MREPRRSSVAARGGYDDMQTITRPRAARCCGSPSRARARLRRSPRAPGSRPPRAAPARAASARLLVLEEVLQRPGDLLGGVDLSGLQPLEQILDRQVQVDHLVGLLEEAVGDGLAHRHAGDALDQVVEALEVLDVEGADDVDAGVEQLEHVLVAACGCCCPGTLVCAISSTTAISGWRAEHRVEVHLLDGDAAVLDAPCAAPRPARRSALRSRRGRASRRSRARRRRRASCSACASSSMR